MRTSTQFNKNEAIHQLLTQVAAGIRRLTLPAPGKHPGSAPPSPPTPDPQHLPFRTMWPPWPPSPPSGPPNSFRGSLWKQLAPLPPRPPRTSTRRWSTKCLFCREHSAGCLSFTPPPDGHPCCLQGAVQREVSEGPWASPLRPLLHPQTFFFFFKKTHIFKDSLAPPHGKTLNYYFKNSSFAVCRHHQNHPAGPRGGWGWAGPDVPRWGGRHPGRSSSCTPFTRPHVLRASRRPAGPRGGAPPDPGPFPRPGSLCGSWASLPFKTRPRPFGSAARANGDAADGREDGVPRPSSLGAAVPGPTPPAGSPAVSPRAASFRGAPWPGPRSPATAAGGRPRGAEPSAPGPPACPAIPPRTASQASWS